MIIRRIIISGVFVAIKVCAVRYLRFGRSNVLPTVVYRIFVPPPHNGKSSIAKPFNKLTRYGRNEEKVDETESLSFFQNSKTVFKFSCSFFTRTVVCVFSRVRYTTISNLQTCNCRMPVYLRLTIGVGQWWLRGNNK